jgi:hypothetical protein
MLICPLFVLAVLAVLTALFALAWRFEPTIVVVLFGVLRSVLAMVGVVARVVIKINTANTANTNNGQININSQNLNILSSQDTNNTKSKWFCF